MCLQEGAYPGDFVQLRSQPGDDLVRGSLAFRERLQGDADIGTRAGPRAEARAADGAHDADHGGVRLNDPGDLLQLVPDQREGSRGIAADAALQLPRVLLREEALRHHDIEVDVQDDRGDERGHHDVPMAQCPVEGLLVVAAH